MCKLYYVAGKNYQTLKLMHMKITSCIYGHKLGISLYACFNLVICIMFCLTLQKGGHSIHVQAVTQIFVSRTLLQSGQALLMSFIWCHSSLCETFADGLLQNRWLLGKFSKLKMWNVRVVQDYPLGSNVTFIIVIKLFVPLLSCGQSCINHNWSTNQSCINHN